MLRSPSPGGQTQTQPVTVEIGSSLLPTQGIPQDSDLYLIFSVLPEIC
jgi:hypothetical protein